MNIEEARKVLWLKSNPRSLGELLDKGYLTKERLEWAAQWAYNYKLKEAAQVLLEAMKNPAPNVNEKPEPKQELRVDSSLPIGITIEKARATPWPFIPYKGQLMGELVESKQLSLKDLGYGIEAAWDDKVRQAAIALALMRLEQVVKEPSGRTGFVHLVRGGRSYAERQQLWLTFLNGLTVGVTIILLMVCVAYLIWDFLTPHPEAKSIAEFTSSPSSLIIFIFTVGILCLGTWFIASLPERISRRLEKLIEEYHRGEDGEDRVAELILQALDGNWHLFRNISLPGRNKGDFDFVLVGPPGVWVLEVKNFRGEYRNIGDRWEYKKGKNWKTASSNPSQQAQKNALRLANFLKADGLNVFVNAVVVWANQESPLFIENPVVAIWPYNRLADELGNIWQVEKFTESERRKITDKLSRLIEQAGKEHQND